MNIATVLRYVEMEGYAHRDWENRWYIMEDYITMAGKMGINFTAALNTADPEALCRQCDGLIIPGSAMDINPKYYGGSDLPPQRDEYAPDAALIKAFLNQGKPILGICGGFQELNIYFGGTIKQVEKAGSHGNGVFHPIRVRKNSFVWDVFQQEEATVNSYHNWQLDQVAPCLEVVAVSADGIPEAFQWTDKHIYGVQWHPDRSFHDTRTSPKEEKFFQDFIDLCRKNQKA